RYKLPRDCLDRTSRMRCAGTTPVHDAGTAMADVLNQHDGDDATTRHSVGSWIKSHKLRTAILGTLGLTGLAAIFGVWSYVGHVAVLDTKIVTLAMALEALDQQKYEEAKNLITRLQTQPGAEDIGGSLFVLGA